jgi:serine carboxypeptidase-like clade 2
VNPRSLIVSLIHVQVGNPDIDNFWDNTGDLDYYYSHAMISTETYRGLKNHCNFLDGECCSVSCNEFFTKMYSEMGNIDPYSIYTDACVHNNTKNMQSLWTRKNPVSSPCLLL